MSVVDFRVPPVIKSAIVKVPPARAFELFAGDLARWWPLAQFHTGPDPVDCTIDVARRSGWERPAIRMVSATSLEDIIVAVD